MDKYRVIEVKQSVFEDNNNDAEILRNSLKEKGTNAYRAVSAENTAPRARSSSDT